MGLISGLKGISPELPSVKKETLNEYFGSKTVKGEIVKIAGEDALIKFPGKTLTAKLEVPLKAGDFINVEFKEATDDKFVLRMVSEKGNNKYVISSERKPENLLNLLNIKDSPDAFPVIKEAVKYKLPLEKEFLTKAMNIIKSAGGDVKSDMAVINFIKANNLPLAAEIFKLIKNFSKKPFVGEELDSLKDNLAFFTDNKEENLPLKDKTRNLLKSLDDFYLKSNFTKEEIKEGLKRVVKDLYRPAEKEVFTKIQEKNAPRDETLENSEGKNFEAKPQIEKKEPVVAQLRSLIKSMEKEIKAEEKGAVIKLLKDFSVEEEKVVLKLLDDLEKEVHGENKSKDLLSLLEDVKMSSTREVPEKLIKLLEEFKKELDIKDFKELVKIIKNFKKEIDLKEIKKNTTLKDNIRDVVNNKKTEKGRMKDLPEKFIEKEIDVRRDVTLENRRLPVKASANKEAFSLLSDKEKNISDLQNVLEKEKSDSSLEKVKLTSLTLKEESEKFVKVLKSAAETIDTLHIMAKNKSEYFNNNFYLALALPLLIRGEPRRGEMRIYKDSSSQKRGEGGGELRIELVLDTSNLGPVGIEIRNKRAERLEFNITVTTVRVRKLFEENISELAEMLKENNFKTGSIKCSVGDVRFPVPDIYPKNNEEDIPFKAIDAKV